jgi:putative ABC transport system permease protein
VVTLGIAAGLAGAGLSAGLISALSLHLPQWRGLLVLPVAVGLAAISGLVNGSSRGTDLISVLFTIALSAVGVADLTYLNLRERAGELAALAASGWGRRQLGRLLTSEAMVTAGTGSVAGAAIGLTIAGVAFGLTLPVLATAALAAVGGIAVTLAAVIIVLLFISARPLAPVLAADD